MKKVKVHIVRAFVRDSKGGNLAGIVFDDLSLTATQKQQIARHVNLSETAFISKGISTDYRLEFYTPTTQIANCGHATVASFGYMHTMDMLEKQELTMETLTGQNGVCVIDGCVTMQQRSPDFKEVPHENILASLGITASDCIGNATIVNTGNAFLILEVKSLEVLKQLVPDFDFVTSISKEYDVAGYYIFTRDVKDADASVRMFAPRYGIKEESATGMAAGPLASYLYRQGMVKSKYLIYQGELMQTPSPSEITVTVTAAGESIIGVSVSGLTSIESVLDVAI